MKILPLSSFHSWWAFHLAIRKTKKFQMKRIILLLFLSLATLPVIAQDYTYEDAKNLIIGFYGGGGLATTHNYDVALSGGIDFNKGIFYRTGLGFAIFYQQISVLYDNEAHGEKDFNGYAGTTILNKSSYVFFTPKFFHSLGKERLCKFYVNAGVGYKMDGTETMHKWDQSNGYAPGNYDSTLNTSTNIKQMVFRVGVGFTEYLHMGGKWWFTITEDLGFLPSSISSTSDVDFASRTKYTPPSISPGYISLHIGIAHTRF
jgi:hypothetical protein